MYPYLYTDCYVSYYVKHILLVHLINCRWDTVSNKSFDFLLDPFCIHMIVIHDTVLYFYVTKSPTRLMFVLIIFDLK